MTRSAAAKHNPNPWIVLAILFTIWTIILCTHSTP